MKFLIGFIKRLRQPKDCSPAQLVAWDPINECQVARRAPATRPPSARRNAPAVACIRKLGFGLGGPAIVGDHSITLSARVNSDAGIVRPSAFAVLTLITNWNFVGCSTGKSAGLAPLRILST